MRPAGPAFPFRRSPHRLEARLSWAQNRGRTPRAQKQTMAARTHDAGERGYRAALLLQYVVAAGTTAMGGVCGRHFAEILTLSANRYDPPSLAVDPILAWVEIEGHLPLAVAHPVAVPGEVQPRSLHPPSDCQTNLSCDLPTHFESIRVVKTIMTVNSITSPASRPRLT